MNLLGKKRLPLVIASIVLILECVIFPCLEAGAENRTHKATDPDGDIEGSFDYPMFPRMDGYKISRYSETENTVAEFDAGVNKYKLTGKAFSYTYMQKRSFQKQKGKIEPENVVKRFVGQIAENGGAVLNKKEDYRTTITGRISNGSKETWTRLTGRFADEKNVTSFEIFVMDVSAGEQIPVNVVQVPSDKLDEHLLKNHPAYDLARRIKLAPSEEETEKAVYELLRVLGIGVYTQSGKPVLRGAEKSDKDFFLYDFQVYILARAIFKERGWRAGDFVSALTNNFSIGIPVKGKEKIVRIDARLIQKTLANRYKLAINDPQNMAHFSTLVIDGLSRLNTYPSTMDRILEPEWRLLDPLTVFLLTMDLLGKGDAEKHSSLTNGNDAFGWNFSFASAAYAANPCEMISGDPNIKEYYGTGYNMANAVAEDFFDQLNLLQEHLPAKVYARGVGQVQKGLGAISLVTDLANIGLLGLAYEISIDSKPGKEHLPHSEAGVHKTMFKFTAKVEFDAGPLLNPVTQCGWLVGMDLPKKGAVKDVLLEWSFIPNPAMMLEVPHSSVKSLVGHAGFWTETNDNGESSFELAAAKQCPKPKGNIEKSKSYIVHISARIATKDTWSIFNPLSGLFELGGNIGGGINSAGTNITVTWHEQGEDLRGRDYSTQAIIGGGSGGYTVMEERRDNPFNFTKRKLIKPKFTK